MDRVPPQSQPWLIVLRCGLRIPRYLPGLCSATFDLPARHRSPCSHHIRDFEQALLVQRCVPRHSSGVRALPRRRYRGVCRSKMKAYHFRGSLGRMNSGPARGPNPRLQRTRFAPLRSPLSRKRSKLAHLWRSFSAIAFLGMSLSCASGRNGVLIRSDTEVRFAGAAEGARVLSSPDVFVRAMSPYDRSARLKTDKDVPETEYLAFVARQARDWSPAEEARIRSILEQFRAKTADLDLALPSSILFVKTTGHEEGMAAYCRGAAVVIPQKLVDRDAAALQDLVFHELFHVYRTHNPAKRRDLYQVIGFDVCPEIVLPTEIRARKITNPDAPLIDSFIQLRTADGVVAVTPVLFARTDRYDTKAGGEFFESMVFQLMVLDKKGDRFEAAVLPGGNADLRDLAQLPDYLGRIGRNTNYVIHPEEILAENFVLMLNSASSVPSPN